MNKCKKDCKSCKKCDDDNSLSLEAYTKEIIEVIADTRSEEIKKELESISPRLFATIGWMAFGRLLNKKSSKIVPNDVI